MNTKNIYCSLLMSSTLALSACNLDDRPRIPPGNTDPVVTDPVVTDPIVTDPLSDYDKDGIIDSEDLDDDNDGMEDSEEIAQGSDPLQSNLVDFTYHLVEDFTEITAATGAVISDDMFQQVSTKQSSYAQLKWISYLSDTANPDFIHYHDVEKAIYRDVDVQFQLSNMACDNYELSISYMRSSAAYTRSLKIDRVEDNYVIQPYRGIGDVTAMTTETYQLATLPSLTETIAIDGSQFLLNQIEVNANCQGFDSDLDGLVDTVEQANNTDPFSSDSDADGFSDSIEVAAGLDPLDAGDGPGADSDSDGITNGDEIDNGLNPISNLDGAEYDSDNDGITNGDEIIRGLDPLDSEDALLDYDQDGMNNRDDAFPNDPNEVLDTDGDRIGNNADDDDDGDGVLDVDDAFPLDASESDEFAQQHVFSAVQETHVDMNIEAEELSLISVMVTSEEVFDKDDFNKINLDDLKFSESQDGQWTFINNSVEPVSQLVVRHNDGEISLLDFNQVVAPFSQVDFYSPTHTLKNLVYQNQMKLFLPRLGFDTQSGQCENNTGETCYDSPNASERSIYEKHLVNMHNALNMVAFDDFIHDFYNNNCADYDPGCGVKKLSTANEHLLKLGAEGHRQEMRVMKVKYQGEGVGGGTTPNIATLTSPESYGWFAVWSGYIDVNHKNYRGYGDATYKTVLHEVAHTRGFSHSSGMTYGLADRYPSFVNTNISVAEKEEMADKKVPELFVDQQRIEDNKVKLNFYRLPNSSTTPVKIKLLSAAEFSGSLALRNEQGNEVILFTDDQPSATMYIRSAQESSKYYSTVKIVAEDFVQ